MQKSIKRYISVLMSSLIIFQNSNYSVEAIKDNNSATGMSFGQKIKYAFCTLRDKIKENPKKSAAVGGGVGLGIILLLLLGIRPWKSQKINNDDKQKETDILHRDDVGAQQQAEKALNVQTEVKPESAVNANSKPEVKHELEPKRVLNAVDICEPDDEAYAYLPTLFNPQESDDEETVSVDFKQEDKLNPEPIAQPETEYCTDYEGVKELFEGYPSSDTIGIVLPTHKGSAHDVNPINVSRSPSPKIDEELKLNKELQIEIDGEVLNAITNFCECGRPFVGVRTIRNVDNVKALIMFLAQIENRHCRPQDITSLLEANATRCWQKLMGFADSKRVIKNEALKEFEQLAKESHFENGVINMKKTRGTNDWGIFKELLLRGISFSADPTNPNRKILLLKDKKLK